MHVHVICSTPATRVLSDSEERCTDAKTNAHSLHATQAGFLLMLVRRSQLDNQPTN